MSTNYSELQGQLEAALIETRLLVQESLQVFSDEHLPLLAHGQASPRTPSSDIFGSSIISKFKIIDSKHFKSDAKTMTFPPLNHGLSAEFERVLGYLDRLHGRLRDRSSRIMVTGDINSGKSTFVNAVIGEAILPVDEQPCTQAFCEISATRPIEFNHELDTLGDKVNIFGFYDLEAFQHTGRNSCKKVTPEELYDMFQSDCPFSYFRIFTDHPFHFKDVAADFDISIIDTPGLNFDSIKTTALLASQQQIDVVIFLMNSANQLTLSAREFLSVAAVEKLHIFIVASKFDQIGQGLRCKARILKQIKEFLPETFVAADDLVHFVGNLHLSPPDYADESFSNLLRSLGKFIIDKRAMSKLLPVKTYLRTLLSELCELTEHATRSLASHARQIHEELRDSLPNYEELLSHDSVLRRQINDTIDEYSLRFFSNAHKRLESVECLITDSLGETAWNGYLHLFSFFASFQSTLQRRTSIVIEAATSEALALLDDAKSLLQSKAFSLVPSLISVIERDVDRIKYASTFELVQTKTFPPFKCDLVGLLYHINPFKHVISTFQNTHLITTIIGVTSFPLLRRFLHDRYIGASCLLATLTVFSYNYLSNFESLICSYAQQTAHRAYIESGWASNRLCSCRPAPESSCGTFPPRYSPPSMPSSHSGVSNGRTGTRPRSSSRGILLRLREHYNRVRAVSVQVGQIDL